MKVNLLEFLAKPAKPRRAWLFQVTTFVLAVLILGATMNGGIRRGMDNWAVFGPEGEQAAISIALSDMVYGLNAGYLGYASVKDRLVSIWNRGAKSSHDPILLENNKNAALLEEALKAASTMGPQSPGYIGDRTLITTIYDDIGYVDYVKLSFRLFGIHFSSMYYTFFVLLGLSSLAFLWTFRNDIPAQCMLIITLLSFYIEMHTAIFNSDMTTFAGQRHGSTLALVPMWHFAFLIMRRHAKPTVVGANWRVRFKIWSVEWRKVADFLLAIFQLLVLILAIKTRGSTVWMVFFIFGVAVAVGFIIASGNGTRRRIDVAYAVASWPVVLIAVGLLANAQYVRMTLHQVYFTDDVLPYHGLWHSAFIGLYPEPSLLPEAVRSYAAYGGDNMGYVAAADYLDRTHFLKRQPNPLEMPSGYISPWTGTLKFRLHDEVMRQVVLEVIKAHPLTVLKLYLIDKPLAIKRVISAIFARSPDMKWLAWAGAGSLAICLILLLAGTAYRDAQLIFVAALATIPFAAMPNLWAYPAFHTVADLFLLTLGNLQILSAVILFFVAGSVLKLLRRRDVRN